MMRVGRERLGGREGEVMSVQVSRTNKGTKVQKTKKKVIIINPKYLVPPYLFSFFLFACLLYYKKKKKSQEETDTIYITSEFTAAQMSSATGVSNPTRHGSRRGLSASNSSSDRRRSRAG